MNHRRKSGSAVAFRKAVAALLLLATLALAGCSNGNSPGFLGELSGGGKSASAAVKEFDAFVADVKNETPEFWKKNIGRNPENYFPEAHKRLRPGMAQKDANDLLNTLALVYLMDPEAKIVVDSGKVSVEGDTAKIEGEALQTTFGGKTVPGQTGAAFVMKYVDNKWYAAEMIKLY